MAETKAQRVSAARGPSAQRNRSPRCPRAAWIDHWHPTLLQWYETEVNQVIVSANTMRALLEAHASMAAWYYQMSAALHEAGTPVAAPNDVQRRAHLAAVANEFPELTALAKSIHMPRAYVPRPAVPVASSVVENEGVAVSAPPASYVPTPAMLQENAPLSAPSNSTDGSVEPPAMVNPLTVKYEDN